MRAVKRDSLTPTVAGDRPVSGTQREFWSSRAAFYFATSGAAIGFGNVWRFPGLCVRYGGGAFFIPYFLALFMIGFPLTILEISFGQYFQTGDIGVFGGFHPRLRGVGVCSLTCATMISSYYVVLIGWVINAFVSSFNEDSPWTNPEISGDEAINYFRDNIVGGHTVTSSNLTPTRIVWKNVGYTTLTWAILYGVTAFGLRMTGRFTYISMGLPFVLLFVFLGRGLSLPGARDGVIAYIGVWDFSAILTAKEAWSVACSQVFFSIGLTFGIMTSYGSHCKRDEPALLNSCVIVILNSAYSIIIGFGIFCALGHLAYLNGVAVTDLPYGGFELIFGTWPVVLATLPGGIYWVRLLFFNLFLLGIDSAVAFLEAAVTVLHDTVFFRNTPRRILLFGCILPSFSFGLLYCTDAGLFFLDVIDFYVNFVMLLVGFLEAFGAAWAYGILDLFKSIGVKATISYMMSNFIPVLISCWLWSSPKYADWVGYAASIVFWDVGLVFTHYFLYQRVKQEPGRWTLRSIWYECAFGNIGRLRDQIQPVVGYIPFVWMPVLKNLVPHTCMMMFFALLSAPNGEGAGDFKGYAVRPYQLLGLLCFIFAIFVFLVGLLVPEVYEPLALPQTKVILSGASLSEERETENIEFSERGSFFSARDRSRKPLI